MKIYKIEFKVGNQTSDIYFSKQEVAEKFTYAITKMRTMKGKKELKISHHIIDVIETEADVLHAFEMAYSNNKV